MNTNKPTAEWHDKKVILSTLWVLVLLNYVFWDLAPMVFDAGAPRVAAGMAGGLVLMFAVFIESAIAMVLLARVLRYPANRWTNIITGAVHAAVIAWSLWAGPAPTAYSLFGMSVIAGCVLIVGVSWSWREPEASPSVGIQAA